MVHDLHVYMEYMIPRSLLAKFKAQKPELHYRSEPLPGIYMHSSDGHHLVAMKPKYGKNRDLSLFIPHSGFDHSDRLSVSSPTSPPNRPPLSRSSTGYSSVFSLDNIATSATSASTTDKLKKSDADRVSTVDICGYRSLREPHQVEWNNVHGRWMFSEEVALRTIIVDMCKARSCRNSPCTCDKKVTRRLIALDDGSSFIAIHGDMTKRNKQKRLDEGDTLYCFDQKTGILTKLSKEEAAVSVEKIRRERKFLCDSDKPSFLKVVEYTKGGLPFL